MDRFLVASTCLLALLVGISVLCSRFTVTITVRPVDAQSAPQSIPAEPAPTNEPAKRPAKVDSHHTKGA